MGLSCAVLFIFLSLLIQSRANQEVKDIRWYKILQFAFTDIKLEYPVNPSPIPRQSEDFFLCDRVKVSGISRLKLGMFVSAYRVTVVPSVAIPERLHSKILVCFHRNNALGLCQCKKDEWKAIQKGRWSSVMSPYEDRYLDVKFIDGVKGSASVTLDEDSQQWRLYFLALGFVLLLLAPIGSWLPFYYSSSMDRGVFLVVLIILFQCIFDAPSTPGAVVARWILCHLIDSLMSGGVMQFVISVDGSVDVRVAQFVKWAMHIIGTTSILQCTLDTPLAVGAVVTCWTLCSLIHSLISGGVRYQTFGFHNIWLRTNEQDISRLTHAEFLSISSVQRRRMLRSSNSRLVWSNSPLRVSAGMNRPSSGMQNQQEYYSTLYKMRNRKKLTEKEWDDFTKESPREALAEWLASPEFMNWIIEHAYRIQLLPSDSSDEAMPSESDSRDENEGRRDGGFQLYNERNGYKRRD